MTSRIENHRSVTAMKRMLQECVQTTTAHGVPHLGNTQNNLLTKLTWIVIVLAALGVFIFHSSCLLIKYSHHETSVSIQLEGTEFIVPDLYICNMQPISRVLMNYKLTNNDSDYLKLASFINGNRSRLVDAFVSRHLPNFSRDFLQNVWSNRNYTDFVLPFIRKNLRAVDVFDRVAHNLHEFCYKLKEKYKFLITQKEPLRLTLYSDAHWFTNLPKPKNPFHYPAGMMPLFLLPPMGRSSHQIIFPIPGVSPYHNKNLVVYAEKGMVTSIEVTMELHQRVSRPHIPCIQNYQNWRKYYNILDHNTSLEYELSEHDCKTIYRQQIIVKKLGCLSPIHPFLHSQWELVNGSYCDSSSLMFHYKLDNETNQICKRLVSCDLPVFNSKVTKYQIRRDEMQSDILHAEDAYPHLYKDLSSNFFNKREKMTFDEKIALYDSVQESFTKIEIRAPQPYSTVYKESLSYETRSLLSDIGGILGFYMGISFVTIFEFLAYTVKYLS